MKLLRFIFRLFRLGLLSILVLTGIVWLCNVWVSRSADSATNFTLETIPKNRVGVLLGTGKLVYNGRVNSFYSARIRAAAALYHAGKVDYLLVSGDNHTKGYNEPEDMQQDLIRAGVPERAIYLDYAGFRTFDSMIRAKKVFGESRFTVISQKFHNERAIFIAQRNGIEAVGYNANDVPEAYGNSVLFREKFARLKAVLDVYLLRTQPKFLGEPIEIG